MVEGRMTRSLYLGVFAQKRGVPARLQVEFNDFE